MAPSPISSNFESAFEIDVHSDMVLKARWDGRGELFDPKAVGAHLPLSKRNSMPMPINGAVSAAAIHNGLKNALANQQLAIKNPSQLLTLNTETLQSAVHRKLDRSYSEPVRPQMQPSQVTTGASRYKTELCRPFAETGKCKYSDKCQFAHGYEELRSMTRHPKYKTELCRTFHSTGLCGYGTRCHFIHNEDERRSPSGSSPPSSIGSPVAMGCRPLGPLSYATPEEYAVGNQTYNVAQSPFPNEATSPLSYGHSNYPDQSAKLYASGPTSPSFSISRASSDEHSPPEVSPTADATFFNPLYSQKDTYLPISHSPPLVPNEILISELANTIFNERLRPLDENTLDHIKLTLGCKLQESPEPQMPFGGGNRNPNHKLRLPIFENLTKV